MSCVGIPMHVYVCVCVHAMYVLYVDAMHVDVTEQLCKQADDA